MTVLDGLAESELQAFRKLPDFVLRHTSHDDQPKFTIAIQCVDVIILEQYAHIVVQQLLCILDAVQCVARKTGYFFCDDEVKHPAFGIFDHAKKAVTLIGARSGNSLINITGNIRPVRVLLNELCVILNLVFQAPLLFHLLRRNTGVEGDPERQVKDRFSLPHLLTQPSNCQHPY